MSTSQTPPSVRVAPLGELRAYMLSEAELNELERGGNASLALNFGIALLSVFGTVSATMLTVELQGNVFAGFFLALLTTLISGSYFLLVGLKDWNKTSKLVKGIKDRLPPLPGVQENTVVVTDHAQQL